MSTAQHPTPPRFQKPGETLEEYHVAMGWRKQRAATIDDANTALAVAIGTRQRLVAALALAEAAQVEVDRLRAGLRTQATDWLCMNCREAWPADIEPADGRCPNCHQTLAPRKDAS